MGADEYLFMEGSVKETIRKESDLLPIDIHLTRMMAKISFKYVTAAAAANLVVNRVIINNMPTHGLFGVVGCFVGVAFGARGNVVDQRLAHEYGRAGMQPQRHFDG